MKIIFFGSDDFALAHLESLVGSEHEVLACVTQPDRPKGRGMKVMVSPIKEYAQAKNIPVCQPTDLTDDAFVKELRELSGDLFVVIAYGQFLPAEVLDMPPSGAINVHPSLLPKYRGAAPINWAIINGDKEAGISIIKMNEKMDAGDVLAQLRVPIEGEETAVTLRAKMTEQGASFLLDTVAGLKGCSAKVQDASQVTFAPKLTKELGLIEWTKSAQEICNLVCGLIPWPAAYTSYNGKLLKVLEAPVAGRDFDLQAPGVVLEVSKSGIVVATGDGNLLIKKVHLQDSKPMDAHSFVIGHKIAVGYRFK